MRTSALVVCFVFFTGLHAQDSLPSATPSQAAVLLRQALRSKATGPEASAAALLAIREHGLTPEGAIAKVLGSALRHKDPEVRLAALAALRGNVAPESLGALLGAADAAELLADEHAAAEYYLALGQKGDARALPVLVEGLHVSRGSPVVNARILAIGHIRSPDSVAALMRFLKSGGSGSGKAKRSRNPHMRDLATALTVLTGESFGADATAWIRWWTEHEHGYALPDFPPELPKRTKRTWSSLWNDKA